MKTSRCLLAVLVAGVVANVLDFIVQGQVLKGAFYSKMESIHMNGGPAYFIMGDFVAVLVFAWVLKRFSASISGGALGGAGAGYYLGILVNFPAYHFIFLTVKGYPYSLAWINTIYGVIWYMIVGAVLGAVMKREAPDTA